MGNQISFEYNRFSNSPPQKNKSNGNSVGKYFIESYISMDLIPFIKKSLNIFQKVIGKRENNYITSFNEFKTMIGEEFGGKEEGDKQTTLI
jgi:hypothetical protein